MIRPELLVPQVNTVGLVAHYKLWAGLTTAGEVFDYSLNGNTGTVTGAVPAYPGFLFADGSRISCGSDSSIDDIFDSGGTFAGWLKPTGKGQGDAGRVFDKSGPGVGILLHTGNSTTTLTYVQRTATTDGQWTFPFDVTGDVWQHVVLTYDADNTATGGAPTIYVDGISVTVTEVVAPDDTRASDAGRTMLIGESSAVGNSWNGKMDEILFFDRLLSAADAKSIFEVTRWRYGV